MNEIVNQIKYGFQGSTAICFLGQAGFVIKSSQGTLLAVDLYLTNSGERKYGFKRLMPRLVSPADIEFDGIVCTHEHYDHFDVDAIPIMVSNPTTQLIAAKDCRKLVERLELNGKNVTYLTEGDTFKLKDVSITAVFCDHGEETPDAVGLVIQVDEKRIYIAGDTCLRLDKVQDIVKYGPFDVMIAPINGAFGNLNEKEMVLLAGEVKPQMVIPCHYWNFAEHGGNPGLFVEELKQICPEQRYYIMALGEMIKI